MRDDSKPPLTTTTSLWPAGIMLVVAVLTLGSFMLIDVITSQRVVRATSNATPIVVGGLARDPHPSHALTYCLQSEEVPRNIADAFQIPVHTTADPGAKTPSLGAGDFDCVQPMTTHAASAGSLISFFNAQLGARGWDLFSKGASNGDPQSLFQKGGDDGFYWVVGITVHSSSPSTVNWTFTIYQNSETI